MYGISHVAVKQKDENMCFAEAVITRADPLWESAILLVTVKLLTVPERPDNSVCLRLHLLRTIAVLTAELVTDAIKQA